MRRFELRWHSFPRLESLDHLLHVFFEVLVHLIQLCCICRVAMDKLGLFHVLLGVVIFLGRHDSFTICAMGLFWDVFHINFPELLADGTLAYAACPRTQSVQKPDHHHFRAHDASIRVYALPKNDLPTFTTIRTVTSCEDHPL